MPIVSPPISPTRPPRLWELQEYIFKDFCHDQPCREGFDCTHYGIRGQTQYGADLLTTTATGSEPDEVDQCKCYQELQARHVKAAADKFIDNWSHWEDYPIQRFVLMVACSRANTRVQDEVRRQRRRFRARGLSFELWDDHKLVSKLRPHRDLVRFYLGEPWVAPLCGDHPEASAVSILPSGPNPALDAITAVIGPIVEDLSEIRNLELERIRTLLREGKASEALGRLTAFRAAGAWRFLPPELRVRTLRLQISAVLDGLEGLPAARALLGEARLITPQGDFRFVEALLAYHSSDVETAMARLEGLEQTDACNLRLALLLSSNRKEEIIAQTDAPAFEPNAETWRLRSLALLLDKRFEDAQEAIGRAVALAPQWQTVRLTQAMVDYYRALLASFHAWGHLAWPVPPEWTFVRRETEAVTSLSRAAGAFARLLDEVSTTDRHRLDYEAWRLGCLANDLAQQAQAEEYTRALLTQNPAHYPAVTWALERGYDIDRAAARAALESQMSTPARPALDAVLALVSLQGAMDDLSAAKETLLQQRGPMERQGGAVPWRFATAQVLSGLREWSAADAIAESEPDPVLRRQLEAEILRIRALESEGAGALAAHLERSLELSADPETLVACAQAKLRANDYAWVADRAAMLLQVAPTTGVLRLALGGLWHDGRSQLCLKLLRAHVDFFPDGRLPADLQGLEVEALRRTGRLAEAARLADELSPVRGDADRLLVQFNAQFAAGNLRGCAHIGQLLLGDERVAAPRLLEAAASVAVHDRALATRLWHEALRRGQGDDQIVLPALVLVRMLDLQEFSAPLLARLPSLAAGGQVPVRTLNSIEEARAYARERQALLEGVNANYNSGTAPIHLLAAMAAHPLVELYHGKLQQNRRLASPLLGSPLLIRHGSRELASDQRIDRGTLVLDVTGLLLAQDVELLAACESAFAPIAISAHLPTSLINQLHQIAPDGVEAQRARQRVLAMTQAGEGSRMHVFDPAPAAGNSPPMPERKWTLSGWRSGAGRRHKMGC